VVTGSLQEKHTVFTKSKKSKGKWVLKQIAGLLSTGTALGKSVFVDAPNCH
jgi:hypothetical protein